MQIEGYVYEKQDFARVLLLKWFPERTSRESRVTREYLLHHHEEFDKLEFSRRVGTPVPPNPDHSPAVQRSTVFSSLKRIDCLAWSGSQPTIVEVKERVTPASLGQILTYRQLLLEEQPDVQHPRLVVAGAFSDPDTIRALNEHGVDVYLYPPADAGGIAAAGGV